MNIRRDVQLALFLAVVLIVLQGSMLWATPTVAVGSCRPAFPSYTTITAAIAGAPAGANVAVCPGTYTEQITVTKDLNFSGVSIGNSGNPTIAPPAAGLVQNTTAYSVPSGFLSGAALAAQIIVSPGITANFTDLTIDATNNNVANCGPLIVGIYFPDSAGIVNHVAFRNQSATCFFDGFAGVMNYPQGDGVLVQSDNTVPANVHIWNSAFHNAGWMAIHADGLGATVEIKSNTAIGPGITYGNGILVEGSASASLVQSNYESNFLLNGQSTGFWGILLNGCTGGTVVNNNVVSNSSSGVVVECNGNTVTSNKIFTSSGDGIQVCGSNNLVQANLVNDSGGAGVNVVQGCLAQNNTITGNTVNGACTGLLVGTDASGNTTSPNSLFNVKSLFLSGSGCS